MSVFKQVNSELKVSNVYRCKGMRLFVTVNVFVAD